VKKTLLIAALAVAVAATLGAGGCCKGCSEKADLDVIPGMEDSGIPDPHAVKEHEKELEQLEKDIADLSREMAEVATDPTLSEAERERRMEEFGKELEIKSKRMEEIAEDIANQDL